MQGKLVLVTGATAGIGKEIARELGQRGAHVVIGSRDAARGARAADDLRAAGSDVDVLPLDTSSQRSIRDFARTFSAAYPRLDVLVNNAGVSQGYRQTSVDGIELTFATNVLGYFLLTCELLDVLVASAPARIVNVASAFAGELDLGDLQFEQRPYDGLQSYAQSKACNRLLTWALARRLEGRGVTANAYTPGFVAGTELSRDMPPSLREAYRNRPGRTIPQGADTAVWLATSEKVDGVSGRFFYDRAERACEFRDEALEERLWGICEQLVGGPCGVLAAS